MAIESEALSESIIGCAIRVHRALGPGLLESVYEHCLAYEFRQAGIAFIRQVDVPIVYGDVRLESGYRLDFVVAGQVVVEIKSIAELDKMHHAQLMTYLRLTGLPVGLLINFNVPVLKDGIVRRVMTHTSSLSATSASPR